MRSKWGKYRLFNNEVEPSFPVLVKSLIDLRFRGRREVCLRLNHAETLKKSGGKGRRMMGG
jgi:hypothetical protein